MQNRSELYYEHAARCEEYAKNDANIWLRDEFIRMAGQWRKLAEQTEQIERHAKGNSCSELRP